MLNAGVGAGRSETSTNNVDALEVPQEFEAVIEIVPEFVELITFIEVVVEEPVHPAGKPQV